MLNLDSRSEINPTPETAVNPQRDGSSPLRLNPMIASKLAFTLLLLLGGPAKAEGAAQCEGQLNVIGVIFADHPNIGTRRVINMTDIYLGNGHFGQAEVYDQRGKEAFDNWDKKDMAKKPKPLNSKDMDDKGAYSFARVPFSGNCDEDNGQAMKVWVTFNKDKSYAIASEVVRNNKAMLHYGGIDEHRVDELQGFIDNPNFTVEKVGDVIKRVSKDAVGVEIAFIDAEQLKGDAKTISEANRQSLRLQVARLMKEQETERKGQGQGNGGKGGGDGQQGGQGSGESGGETGGVPVVPMAAGGTGLLALIYRFLPFGPHFVKGGHKII